MKKVFLIFNLSFLILLSGCKHDTFTISGTLEGGAGKTLWLEEIAPDGPLFIDSIAVDGKGHFKYTYKMPYRSLYNLHTSEDNMFDTSYETYLRGEISTYSDKMLQLYAGYVIRSARGGVNIAKATIENTARLYGYSDLEAFQASIEE